MTYAELDATVKGLGDHLPIIGNNDNGEQTVITRVKETIGVDGELVESYCYIVHTYLKSGAVQTEKYYDINVETVEVTGP